jgi:iron complex outermembrane receptor protein
MRHHLSTRRGALLVPALYLLAAPAQSQEVAAPAERTIDEVVVTAQRRSESIQDVPIAITAVGAETLENQNVKGVEDYFALTPNVSFRSDGSRDRKDLSMRGISNQLNPYSNVRQATYAFYIDEFNVVAGTSNPQIVDLERIEVLRGPQGTYFGRNAVGGAINVITKKPDNLWYGEIGLEYSSFDTRGGHGVINVPVIDGVLALRASGQIETSDGWIKNINPIGGGNDYDYVTGRVQARFTPNDRLTWDFAYSYSDEETDRLHHRDLALGLLRQCPGRHHRSRRRGLLSEQQEPGEFQPSAEGRQPVRLLQHAGRVRVRQRRPDGRGRPHRIRHLQLR